MKSIKIWLLACTLAMMGSSAAAQPLNETEEFDEDTLTEESYQLMMEEMVNSLNYQTGKISLYNAATITVPSGYAFLNTKDAMFILSDLWGNPVDSTIVGMLVPTKYKMYEEKSYAFTIHFEDIGYVKDGDAADINYDDLLKELQKESETENRMRAANGFPKMDLVGWASTPYYDNNLKVLHWAKEFKVEGSEFNTLNYNLRILGRKGVYFVNAIARMDELKEVKADVPKLIKAIKFNEGSRYQDFDSKVDDVAAWSIGGLVAGKILAKTGFFVLLAKFWKFIAIGVAAGGSFIWKMFKKKEEEPQVKNQ